MRHDGLARSAYVDHLKVQRAASVDIRRVLRQAAVDAERQVAAIAGQGIGAQVRREQLRAVTNSLRGLNSDLWNEVGSLTRRGIREAAEIAVEGNTVLGEVLARSGSDEALATQFVAAARHSVESVQAKYLNDVRLSPLVYKNQQVGIARVQRIVASGLARNLSARELARSVRHLIHPSTPGGVSYASMRLARTEINNAFHGVNTQWFNSSPFVTGVKWELSGSHPQPDICDDLADDDHDNIGKGVFLPQHVPQKPHPHCLCYTVPITPTPEQIAQNLNSGSYDGWMREQGLVTFLPVR